MLSRYCVAPNEAAWSGGSPAGGITSRCIVSPEVARLVVAMQAVWQRLSNLLVLLLVLEEVLYGLIFLALHRDKTVVVLLELYSFLYILK